MQLNNKATVQIMYDLKKRILHLEQSQYAARYQELANGGYS